MYGKKFIKRLIAVTMAMSVFLSVQVRATTTSEDTTVTLDIGAMTYTMTIPMHTTISSTGDPTALINGLNVKDGNLLFGRKLVVTASSDDWTLNQADASITTSIKYALYDTATVDVDTPTKTVWEFKGSEISNTTGKTYDIYAKGNEVDIFNAESGSYTDNVTFTAKIESALLSVESNNATYVSGEVLIDVEDCSTWQDVIDKTFNTHIVMYNNYIIYDVQPENGNEGQYFYLYDETARGYVYPSTIYDKTHEITFHYVS